MAKQKPLQTFYLRTSSPDEPPSKPRVFRVHRIGEFHNERPGCEWEFVYGSGQ